MSIEQIKEDILSYLQARPSCMNIEVILDLGITKLQWKQATDQLKAEGKISSRIKYTSSACRNPDGSISHSGLVYHEKDCTCWSCKL
jgi:hypothetical protein